MLMAKKAPNPWAPKLKKLRAALGLTQAEAAAKAGVALRTWINWENGARGPGPVSLRLLQLTFPGRL